MTLRCLIQIVPYGEEEDKRDLFKLDISNMGVIRDEGFGHKICEYKVKVFEKQNEVLKRIAKEKGEELPEWDFIDEYDIPEHDRRDGAIALVEKACKVVTEDLG